MIPRVLGSLPLATGLLLAACGSSSSAPTGAPAATGAASAALAVPTAEAPRPPDPPAPSSALPPASSVPPTSPASAAAPSAIPSAGPLSVRPATPAATAATSVKPPPAAVDAGASDAGASAMAADAGAPSPGLQMAQKIDAVFAKSKTYAARFTQKYTMKVTGSEKLSTGVVSMERPNKISFRYDLPSKNRIVSDGITLKVYIADDNQMFETPVGKTEYPGALAFMMGKGIASSFTFSLRPTRYAGVALEGKPLVPNPTYQTVTFLVDTHLLGNSDVGAMTAVILQDAQDNRNRFDFQGASQPASFPADEFTFKPPPGTNVVRSP